MGRPVHYSSEVPKRCQALIDMLGPLIETGEAAEQRWGGPLRTTFLLAMATPMVVLPMERIFNAVTGSPGAADDSDLDPELSGQVRSVLGGDRAFSDAPFFTPGVWRLVADGPAFEVGGDWPHDRLDNLRSPAALEAAAKAKAKVVMKLLRNALAHGGVTYLDAQGGQTYSATNQVGFASLFKVDGERRLKLLSVPVSDFEVFLRLWTEWLAASGVAKALEVSGPGYFKVPAT